MVDPSEQKPPEANAAGSNSTSAKSTPVQLLIFGKDEMNLAEFPIARLGRNDTRLTIEYEGQTVKDGKVLLQKWIASGSAAFGLPTEFAERVLVSLMTLTARAGFAERKVPFTIYRVLKMLGLSHNQRNYQAVENALQQLVGVTIYSEGAFYDKTNDRRVTTKKGFHLLEEYWLKSQESDEGVIEAEGVQGYVVWSERIWESFKAGYIKNLDTDFYYSLDSTLARRLYRFLDKRMRYQTEYEIDVFDLAGRIGMMSYPYPSRVVNKLQPAIDELMTRGYLASADAVKVGKYTRMRFVRSETTWFALDGVEGLYNSLEDVEPSESPVSPETASCGPSDALQGIWKAILREFEIALPWGSYSMMMDSALVDVEGTEAIVSVSPRSQQWMEHRMRAQILSKLRVHLTVEVERIRFVVRAEPLV